MQAEIAHSLERAFDLFQKQSEKLERTHLELQHKLNNTQFTLEKKNIELAHRIGETEDIKVNLLGILEAINDAVLLVGPSRSIKVANRAAMQLLDQIGEKGLFLIPEIGLEIGEDRQVRDKDIEFEVSGETRTFQLSVIHTNKHVQASDTVISLTDVTEKRQLQRVGARDDRMAALGQVAASIAHEIRNPLAAIEGFATLLTRDLVDDPNSLRLASKTVYAARQLNSVVTNMLSYTREVVIHSALIDINELLKQSLELVAPQAEDQKIEIKLLLNKEPLFVEVDSVQFTQVIINLVTNAIEATPFDKQGVVTIKTYSTKNFICLEVIDNGDGVPLPKKQKIFDPFYSAKDGGVGLGLSLCRRIIDAHNGTIFENGVDGGCFTVKLNKEQGAK